VPGAKRFIEIGCGSGRYLVYFAREFGYEVWGIDNSEEAYSMAKMNLKYFKIEANLVKSDFLKLNLPKNHFDIVFSCGLFEHFDDPTAVLAKSLSLLKKGGQIMTIVTNFGGLFGKIRKFINPDIYEIDNPSAPDCVLRAYHSLGLRNIESGYFGSLRLPVLNPNEIHSKKIPKKLIPLLRRGFNAFNIIAVYIYRKTGLQINGKFFSSEFFVYGEKNRL